MLVSRVLVKALKQIAHLKDKVQRLDEDLRKKESILFSFIAVATEQSRRAAESTWPAGPQPLFPPTALLIGDSITRKVRFFNAITHCLPGVTVPVLQSRVES